MDNNKQEQNIDEGLARGSSPVRQRNEAGDLLVDNTALLLRLLTEQQQAMRMQQEENRRQQELAIRNQEAQQKLLEGMIQTKR